MEKVISSVSELMSQCSSSGERRRFARQQMFIRVFAIWADPLSKRPSMMATLLSDRSQSGLCIFAEAGRLQKGLGVLIVSNDASCVPFQVVGKVVSIEPALNGKDRVGIQFGAEGLEFNRHSSRDWNSFLESTRPSGG